jgi:hypothetical protein
MKNLDLAAVELADDRPFPVIHSLRKIVEIHLERRRWHGEGSGARGSRVEHEEHRESLCENLCDSLPENLKMRRFVTPVHIILHTTISVAGKSFLRHHRRI